jgi:hypothetical protein
VHTRQWSNHFSSSSVTGTRKSQVADYQMENDKDMGDILDLPTTGHVGVS